MDEDAKRQRMVDLLVAGINYDDRTKNNPLPNIESRVHADQVPFIERKMPYTDLSNLVGKEVLIVFGETLLLNWNRGPVEYRNGSYFVKCETNSRSYKIKRISDCRQFPWLGDGIWFEGRYLGQVD